MAEFIIVSCLLFSVVTWIIVLVGMMISRLTGKCPYACFNTKCHWRFFCRRFVTLAYNIEHVTQMLKDSEEKKRAEKANEAEKSGDNV